MGLLSKIFGKKKPIYTITYAVETGNIEMVKMLVESGTDINTDFQGRTLLIEATEKGNAEIVKYLIESGADVNRTGLPGGITALFIASERGYFEIVKHLVYSGAEVNIQHRTYGWTPLYLASKYGNLEIVRFLIDYGGADINKAKNDGTTPLDIATQNGHFDVRKLLVASGALLKNTNTNKSQIIEINEFREFFKNIAREIDTTNPDEVYTKIQVYCAKCNFHYSQAMLEMLVSIGMFGGARMVVVGGTKQGNDTRSGKCSQCGHTKMKIIYSVDNNKTKKNRSVFCVLCNTRYPIDKVIDVNITQGNIITFVCPNCKVPRAYNPLTDKGF